MEVESLLYLTGRPLTTDDIKTFTGYSNRIITTALEELMEDYARRTTALEIIQVSPGIYLMRLKNTFSKKKKIAQLMPKGYLSEGVLKTLSFIAINQPITMYKVTKHLGSHTYKYVRELEDKKFIQARMKDRTKILKTTSYFATYFCLSSNVKEMQEQLLSEISV